MVIWHLWYHPKRMHKRFNYHSFRIWWQPFLHLFWGLSVYANNIPQEVTGFSKLWTGLSHDPRCWPLVVQIHGSFCIIGLSIFQWYTWIEVSKARCSFLSIILHLLTNSKACSYQEFWRLFAGFLLETPGFLPILRPLACRIHLDVSQMPKASSKSNAGGTSCCPPCCGKGLPGHQSFPAFDHHQSSIKKKELTGFNGNINPPLFGKYYW